MKRRAYAAAWTKQRKNWSASTAPATGTRVVRCTLVSRSSAAARGDAQGAGFTAPSHGIEVGSDSVRAGPKAVAERIDRCFAPIADAAVRSTAWGCSSRSASGTWARSPCTRTGSKSEVASAFSPAGPLLTRRCALDLVAAHWDDLPVLVPLLISSVAAGSRHTGALRGRCLARGQVSPCGLAGRGALSTPASSVCP